MIGWTLEFETTKNRLGNHLSVYQLHNDSTMINGSSSFPQTRTRTKTRQCCLDSDSGISGSWIMDYGTWTTWSACNGNKISWYFAGIRNESKIMRAKPFPSWVLVILLSGQSAGIQNESKISKAKLIFPPGVWAIQSKRDFSTPINSAMRSWRRIWLHPPKALGGNWNFSFSKTLQRFSTKITEENWQKTENSFTLPKSVGNWSLS